MEAIGAGNQVLPIHFEVPRHELPLHAFLATAQSASDILNAFNQKLFAGSLHYEVVVLPPEDGTFLTKLRVDVKTVGTFLVLGAATAIVADFSTGLVAGLTTRPPSDWGELLGGTIRQGITDALDSTQDDEVRCRAGAMVVVGATKWFLESEPETLNAAGLTVDILPDGFRAKNEFYEACEALPDLKGVGFDNTPFFPIRREEFNRLQTPIPNPDDEVPYWQIETAYISVTSPNWERSDSRRRWKGIDATKKNRVFHILDEAFWGRLMREELQTHIRDTMRVQWAFQVTPRGPTNFKVLSVLEFNGTAVSPLKSDQEIERILGEFTVVIDDEPDLFE